VIVVEVDRDEAVPGYESWWDVAVAEVSEDSSVRAARETYETARRDERSHV
jgi:3D-(3,5/4)-trihydroxycyclohexane-1,2-dione acylhydrolase (decyclizing)